jgi:hypothetical protein
MRKPFYDRYLALIIVFVTTVAHTQSPDQANLVLHKLHNGLWQGSCSERTEVFQTAVFTLDTTKSIKTGSWRKDIDPSAVWAGIEVDSGYVDSTISINGILSLIRVKVANSYVDSTIEIEVYAGGSGVLRSQDGWYAISDFSQSAQILRFRVDTQEIQPNNLDRDIIKRAAIILSSDSVWNRADNRECEPTATKWSIYCAMERATIEVTGAFHHRRPALQLIRRIVDERTVSRHYHHRLMDYNNDPTTTFKDVTSLFSDALARIHQ